MTKYRKPILAVLVALLLVALPVINRLNVQSRQIEQSATAVKELQVRLADNQVNFEADKERAQVELNRRDQELASARLQITQLQKELDTAKATAAKLAKRPVVRVEQPTVTTSGSASIGTKPKASATVTVGKSGSCESYRSLVAQFFPAGQVSNALVAMKRESGCRPNAISPSGDYGLMQIHFAAHSKKVGGNASALLDPRTNVKVAAQVYQESGGWGPWTTMN